jgi:glycosyltransferase involved in cell wall biosynthesis
MILLSILIATIKGRERSFAELVEHLTAQCRRDGLLPAGDAEGKVEILWEKDNKQISIGAKRQRLLERARGKFVAFVDDDDWVSDHYARRICEAIEAHPDIDCIGLVGEHTTNGANPESFVGSLRYREWAEDRDGYRYVRSPYHKNPVARTAALRAGFRDERFGEDRSYSMRLLDVLRRECFIADEALYYHRYSPDIPHGPKYGITAGRPSSIVQVIWTAHAPDCPRVPRFSVAVIARNEAHTLPRLLRSLDAFMRRGGEVVVVDTGSADDTPEVARRYGCRVVDAGRRFDTRLDAAQVEAIERRFARGGEGPLVTAGVRLFHFAEARQHAGLLAGNDRVLQLDASDEVLALDVDALEARLASARMGLLEYDLQLGGVTLAVSRFYDRRLHHWEGRVHEGLYGNAAADPPPGSRIRLTGRELLVRHHKDEAKSRSYLAGLALDALARPGQARWKHYLGRELYYHRRYRSAIAVLEEHAAMTDAWSAERSQSLCFIGECLEALDEPDEATQSYRRASRVDPTRREPLLRLAALCSRRGDFHGAATSASEALAIARTSAFAELDASYTWLPHSILYWSLFWLGRREDARLHWETCRRLAPDDPRFLDHARLFPAAMPAPATAGGGAHEA